MDNNKKNIVIAIVASLIMVGIIYFKFFNTPSEKNLNTFERIDDQAPDQSSKREEYERIRQKKFEELKQNRSVGSIDDFLENQKSEQPFGEPEPVVMDTIAETQTDPVKLKHETEEKKENPKAIVRRVVYREPTPEPKPVKKVLTRDRFYTAYDVDGKNITVENENRSRNFIKAVVYRDHQVSSGSPVRIRLIESGMIEGRVIQKNTILTGTAQLSENRVLIYFNDLVSGNQQSSLALEVYSMDGVKGLNVPGGIDHQLKQDAADMAGNQISTTVNLPVVGGLTVRSAKKKLKEAVINIPDGTHILIK